jgi:hypothetical protein
MIHSTAFHTRLFAEELTQRFASDHDEKLAGALVDAQVDLNPHQCRPFCVQVSFV